MPAVVLAVLLFSACADGGAAAGGSADGESAGGPSIEVAVSGACVPGSSSQCVQVSGESVTLPSAFEEAAVQDATVVTGNGQNTVNVTFTAGGSTVLASVTQRAVEAGAAARLLIRASGEIIAAPVVLASIESREVTIALSPGTDAQAIVDSILSH